MSEDLKNRTRAFYERVSAGDMSVLDEMIADDFVEHEEFPEIEPNKDGAKQFFALFRAAFPDMRMEPHEVLVDGDLVCVRITMSGTHHGDFMGMPPTGRRFEAKAIDILRMRDGQAVEHWGVTDTMTMMEQLGAIPESAPA